MNAILDCGVPETIPERVDIVTLVRDNLETTCIVVGDSFTFHPFNRVIAEGTSKVSECGTSKVSECGCTDKCSNGENCLHFVLPFELVCN